MNTESSQQAVQKLFFSGLLSDRLLVRLLKRLIRTSAPRATIIIGNFAPQAQVVAYMTVVTDWLLNFRTKEQLKAIGEQACTNGEAFTVYSDRYAVNLYLRVSKV